MTRSDFLSRALMAGLSVTCLCLPALAADISGVWATDPSACNKIFAKNGNRVSFANNADTYGGGFIIEGGEIRGRMATCKIKTSKEDGPIVHMVAACATDIMLSDVQLSVKILDAGKLSRLFPGIPEMDITYYRCSL